MSCLCTFSQRVKAYYELYAYAQKKEKRKKWQLLSIDDVAKYLKK